MLRWSARETNRNVDLRAIADPETDPLVPGGPELAAMARAAVGTEPDPAPVRRVAEVLGGRTATDAAAVAAAFESFNRVVDGTGLPVGKGARKRAADIIELLGLHRFPHADHGA